ncbi:hypothetical protein POM88_055030 [Heracleum sosnowskyi]|uniref:Endonuclease/exonuclease/phosphatase domain-containing protein n=1 Tax=Heracleum sosnowskyi TaxID=360622 RepID=A0AAD8GLB3_9APIA|nr:hypothetical protein POM88_055030 [Heracleum sosnowskyi]
MEELVILCWNIRGVNKDTNRANVKHTALKNQTNIICLQETKCSNWSQSMQNDIWDVADHGWAIQNSEGFSGGLLTSWDKDLFEEVGVKTNKNWLWISLRSKNTGVKFHCVNIYAPQEPREKREVWKALSIEFMKDELDPVCFMGDFNAIRSIEERKDCSYRRADTHDFNKFIKDLNLLEIPMSNDSFKLEKF